MQCSNTARRIILSILGQTSRERINLKIDLKMIEQIEHRDSQTARNCWAMIENYLAKIEREETGYMAQEEETLTNPLGRLGIDAEEIRRQTQSMRRENWTPPKWVSNVRDCCMTFLREGFEGFSLADAERYGFKNTRHAMNPLVKGGYLIVERGKVLIPYTNAKGTLCHNSSPCAVYKRGPKFESWFTGKAG